MRASGRWCGTWPADRRLFAAGALSFDKDYTYRRQVLMQQQAGSTTSGVKQGLQAVSLGLRAGASGFINEPVRGAIDGGTKGFIKGVGRGLVGVVAKPTSGLAALVSKTTEGLASDAKRVTVRGKEAKGGHELRVRQPRELGPVLLPYPGAPSLQFTPLVNTPPSALEEPREGDNNQGRS